MTNVIVKMWCACINEFIGHFFFAELTYAIEERIPGCIRE